MNITFIISSMGSGGAERVIANLANRLGEIGHNVTIVVFGEEISYYRLNNNVKLKSYKYVSTNRISTFYQAIKSARKAFKETKPDVIVSFLTTINIFSIIANMDRKTPIIISERNDPKIVPWEWYYRLLRSVVYRFSDGFVFQTEESKSFFSKRIQKRSIIIQNPVYISSDNSMHKTTKEKVIVSVGRLEEQKNQKLLIDAFDKISHKYLDYNLVIYGEGNLRNELTEYINKKGLRTRVFLPGRVKNIAEKLNESSLFVLSSNYEGMPNSLMEAMAVGLPCISTDCAGGGPRELITDGENGILVPIKNSSELAKAIQKIIDNKALANSLGNQARNICQSNSIDIIVNQWERYILKICGKCQNIK